MKRIGSMLILLTVLAAFGFSQGNRMSDSDEMMMDGGTVKADFTTIENAMMMAERRPAVLFFYATWCPTCRKAMAEIDERIADLDGVTVIVVNYDRETSLKKKYGITYQHTFVQIDGAGEKVAVWSGGGVDDILENVVFESK